MSEPIRCSGVTIAGHPCKQSATGPSGTCAWHDPERHARAVAGRTTTPTKVCRGCGRELARRHFPPTGNRSPVTGERYGGADCYDCLEKARRAAGVPVRHVRINARGDVWCNACRRYLPPDRFKRHPSRPHTWWSYCRDCTAAKDRDRYHRTKFRPDKAAGALERTRRKADRRRVDHRERAAFVATAIDTLRRRGFTHAEVSRLARVSQCRLYGWERKTQRPTPAVEARFAELIEATRHMPIGTERPRGRRLPHPEFDRVFAATAGMEDRHPTRSRWKKQTEPTALPAPNERRRAA